jgi:5-hydroxyisourate hydrolase
MGQLTTHVLDTSAGLPAAAVRIEVHAWSELAPRLLTRAVTGADGRCAGPLLAGEDFHAGRYSLTFQIGEYFRTRGVQLPQPAFLEEAVIRIGIADATAHYHVPLLISPWSYSVYRGG